MIVSIKWGNYSLQVYVMANRDYFFLALWVFWYMTRGIKAVLPSLPKELLTASAISELYLQICSFIEFGQMHLFL